MIAAVVLISIDSPCSEPPVSLALVKMHPGLVQIPRKCHPIAAVSGQWSAEEEQAKQRGSWGFPVT